MATTHTKASITGRDGYIMAKALYWALKFSQNQPNSIREFGDESDIKAILNARFPFFAAGFKLADESVLKLIKNGATGGVKEADHEKLIAYVSPPDLSDDPEFLEDGEAPTPPPGFVDEDETKPLAPDSDKNRRDLNATIQGTLGAFREPK